MTSLFASSSAFSTCTAGQQLALPLQRKVFKGPSTPQSRPGRGARYETVAICSVHCTVTVSHVLDGPMHVGSAGVSTALVAPALSLPVRGAGSRPRLAFRGLTIQMQQMKTKRTKFCFRNDLGPSPGKQSKAWAKGLCPLSFQCELWLLEGRVSVCLCGADYCSSLLQEVLAQ